MSTIHMLGQQHICPLCFSVQYTDFKLSWSPNVMELKIYVNNKLLSLYFYKKVLPINIILWQ